MILVIVAMTHMDQVARFRSHFKSCQSTAIIPNAEPCNKPVSVVHSPPVSLLCVCACFCVSNHTSGFYLHLKNYYKSAT